MTFKDLKLCQRRILSNLYQFPMKKCNITLNNKQIFQLDFMFEHNVVVLLAVVRGHGSKQFTLSSGDKDISEYACNIKKRRKNEEREEMHEKELLVMQQTSFKKNKNNEQ